MDVEKINTAFAAEAATAPYMTLAEIYTYLLITNLPRVQYN